MRIWMLSKFYWTQNGEWPVADSYGSCIWFFHPDYSGEWGLGLCEATATQIEAAEQDPRVQPYRTTWDTITPDTVTAYASVGATPGMMLGQLLSLLAKVEPGYVGCV